MKSEIIIPILAIAAGFIMNEQVKLQKPPAKIVVESSGEEVVEIVKTPGCDCKPCVCKPDCECPEQARIAEVKESPVKEDAKQHDAVQVASTAVGAKEREPIAAAGPVCGPQGCSVATSSPSSSRQGFFKGRFRRR